RLSDILDSGPVAYGLDTGIWTSPMIAWAIEEEFGVVYHPGHVRKLLHHLGFSVQRLAGCWPVPTAASRTAGIATSIRA
ncbi:MAG: winged helix-turn-helix domain-containing protein, partial [Terriglobia bacterium]